jgi:hypothetical protein
MSLFLSYRRADSREVVGRIYDLLITHFPIESVFRDLDSLPLGTPFPEALDEAVSKARAALVVIGPIWVSVTDPTGRRRLDDQGDFVRREVERALASGIVVVPVLVSGAAMPTAGELPDSIRPLASRNAASVRPDPDFHHDMDRLIRGLARALDMPGVVETPAGVRASAGRRVWAALCDIRQFIGHELPATVMRGGVIDGADWESIHRGWRIIQAEQVALPPTVFAAAVALMTDVLQPGLNRFLDTLRAAIAARGEPGYAGQGWVVRVDQQLRRVQEEFAGGLAPLPEMLRHVGC